MSIVYYDKYVFKQVPFVQVLVYVLLFYYKSNRLFFKPWHNYICNML